MIALNQDTPFAAWDIETDGLLDGLTRVHLLTIKTPITAAIAFRRNDVEDSIEEGLRHLMDLAALGCLLVGHNIIKFDIPAIQKIYPWFALPWQQVFDTLTFARLKFADTYALDAKLKAKGKLPQNFFGMHGLEAWGARMGELKGEYEGDPAIEDPKERKARKWERWNPAMETYAIQDAVVTEALYLKLKPWEYSPEAIDLEHHVSRILTRQERFGVCFDEKAAVSLYAELADRRQKLDDELRTTVPGAFWPDGKLFTPKRDNKAMHYTAGAQLQKVIWKEFNPSSRAAIARFFKLRYGWSPEKFSETGDPTIDDEVLSGLEFPEAKLLAEYFLIEKRIGQLAEGQQALMRSVKDDGRIHGSVNPNGAVTGRMTHAYPNLAQVPKVGTKYGKEFRQLFRPPQGMIQVGCDAAGLELRNLAHFVAPFDGGSYIKAVIEGREEDGTDIHSVNTRALGLEPQKLYVISGRQQKGRNCGKTFIYAWLYGAGDEKIGNITGQGRKEGSKLKASFLRKSPGLAKLKKKVAEAVKAKGYLRGLDGRQLSVRSAHAALNTLLQSAGAVVMKKAQCIADDDFQAAGLVPGVDYEFMLTVHDEAQLATLPQHAEFVGETFAAAIRKAGEYFKFRCPLGGEFKVGANWSETH